MNSPDNSGPTTNLETLLAEADTHVERVSRLFQYRHRLAALIRMLSGEQFSSEELTGVVRGILIRFSQSPGWTFREILVMLIEAIGERPSCHVGGFSVQPDSHSPGRFPESPSSNTEVDHERTDQEARNDT